MTTTKGLGAILIGRGILTWDMSERISDRYGAVYVVNSGNSLTPTIDFAPMAVRLEHLGLRCALKVHVIETRDSTHIGDLFRGVSPTRPEVGETIILGTGLLFTERGMDRGTAYMRVGVRPFDDDRETDWLDIKALYRSHEQTVELYYEVLEPKKG